MIFRPHPARAQRQPSVRWTGLAGAATALYLRARQQAPARVLLVAADAAEAARLEEELRSSRRRPACLRVPGLRDAALRPVLAAPRHHLAAPAHAGAAAGAQARHRRHRPADGAAAPAAAHVHRRPCARSSRREELDLEAFRLRLAAAGYASVPQVGDPGDFAIRGSLFDVFPMGSDPPLRIDLFDRQSTASAASTLIPSARRPARSARAAAGPRVLVDRRRDPRFSPALPHSLRG